MNGFGKSNNHKALKNSTDTNSDNGTNLHVLIAGPLKDLVVINNEQ